MEYRALGRTGLRVSALALGTEFLNGQPRETVASVIHQAIEGGVNFFDVVFSMPDYLDNLGAAFCGHRDRVFLTGHLGSAVKDDQYCKTRSLKRCDATFHDLLTRLGTDHVDVLFLHNFNTEKDWEASARRDGFVDLARRLRDQGRAHFIGISAHMVPVVARAVASGLVDLVMFPLNLLGHAMPGRRQLQELCIQDGVGLLAMKPFGGGKLLAGKGTVRAPKYETGGETFQASVPAGVSPVQCLSYALAQVGVSAAVTGVRTPAELGAMLYTLDATEAERDFSGLLAHFGRYQEGECVYCNHCLPCPAAIDIGQVNRLLDAAQWGLPTGLQAEYDGLPVRASTCTECGACMPRCPFGVDVIANIRATIWLFEPSLAREAA